jgi:hypothetical protein
LEEGAAAELVDAESGRGSGVIRAGRGRVVAGLGGWKGSVLGLPHEHSTYLGKGD